MDWFWTKFDKEKEFSKADRNAVIFMGDGKIIPYPIENHMFLFDSETQKGFIKDLLNISASNYSQYDNFEEFLQKRFGMTLYHLYFNPYNKKIWRKDLNKVPISWLEGKLPMPSVEEILFNNINQVREKSFVHSSFWYENENGSQFIADRLAEKLDIKYNTEIKKLYYNKGKWIVEDEEFDKVVFCGNIKDLPLIVNGLSLEYYKRSIDSLEYHGTTTVFCEINKNPYSWIYLPDSSYDSHRIICTGNFAISNNAPEKTTATVEFTDYISENDIKINLKKIPLNPQYIAHHYNKYTYPIQNKNTRSMIASLKDFMAQSNFYFTGRFADWEYYNMDVAIGAAMDNMERILK